VLESESEFGGTRLSLSLDTSVGERRSVEDAALALFRQRNGSEGMRKGESFVRRLGKILGVGWRVDGRRYMAGDVQGWDGPRFRRLDWSVWP
jgi:hypothetical protein